MPKIVPHNNHTKTKEKVRNDNIILVKTAVPEDHHNGFQAYGPDGSIGKGKLGAHGIHEFQVDFVVEAKKRSLAKQEESEWASLNDASRRGVRRRPVVRRGVGAAVCGSAA